MPAILWLCGNVSLLKIHLSAFTNKTVISDRKNQCHRAWECLGALYAKLALASLNNIKIQRINVLQIFAADAFW